mmetsp:Transcript_52874/g.82441  ORF Transcript_52874/g.82441 Transcript_52874/m.82441 type:complete len:84 (+) Transcript_52874:1385-1636(+)
MAAFSWRQVWIFENSSRIQTERSCMRFRRFTCICRLQSGLRHSPASQPLNYLEKGVSEMAWREYDPRCFERLAFKMCCACCLQ